MFEFGSLSPKDDAVQKVKQAIAKASRLNIPLVQVGKTKRQDGTSVKPLAFNLSNGDILHLMVRQNGDVYRTTLNDHELPMRSDVSSLDAFAKEIAGHVKQNGKSFSARMLGVMRRVQPPAKIQTKRQKLDDLSDRSGELDKAIEQAISHRDQLKQKLPAPLTA